MNKLQKIVSGKLDETYIIAEIGINHNGLLSNALELIYKAVATGVDAVKFQKEI